MSEAYISVVPKAGPGSLIRHGRRLVAVALVAGFLTACSFASVPASPAQAPAPARRDLLIAYDILADTLADEAKLKWLALLKRMTFSRAVPEVEALMKRISASASRRARELEELRKLPPDVSMKPEGADAIGDAITAVAKEAGSAELLGRDELGVRVIVLQGQATRMVTAIATAAAQMETQPRRKAWLESLASEYEGLREDALSVLVLYILQKGAAQQPKGS